MAEKRELPALYVGHGLRKVLATQVPDELMTHDALSAHARGELGISDLKRANPLQAAIVWATCFASGAAVPVAVAWLTPEASAVVWLETTSLLFLAALGGIAARTGRSAALAGAIRVAFWGAMALAVTADAGRRLGASI